MQGASPLASPGLSRRRHLQNLPSRYPAGGLLSLSPACLRRGGTGGDGTIRRKRRRRLRWSLPRGRANKCRRGLAFLVAFLPFYFSLLFCPHPPDPLPLRGRGGIIVFLCKGLRPLHPQHLTACGTYRACQAGARSGALPLARRGWGSVPIPGGRVAVETRLW